MARTTITLSLIIGLALTQVGVFSIEQAQALGVSRAAIQRLVAAGHIRRIWRGIYVLTTVEYTWRQGLMAGQLLVGEPSAGCRRTAAMALELDGIDPLAEIDLWFPRPVRGPFRLCRSIVHPSALVATGPFRHTDAVTTMCHLGAVVSAAVVERALESVLRKRLATWDALEARLGWCGATGLGTLREVLAIRPRDLKPTESFLETVLWQLVRTSDLLRADMPARQHEILDGDAVRFRLDFAWVRLGLALEADGKQHKDADGKPRPYDRYRDVELAARGITVLPFTYAEIVFHGRATLRQIERAYLAATAKLAG